MTVQNQQLSSQVHFYFTEFSVAHNGLCVNNLSLPCAPSAAVSSIFLIFDGISPWLGKKIFVPSKFIIWYSPVPILVLVKWAHLQNRKVHACMMQFSMGQACNITYAQWSCLHSCINCMLTSIMSILHNSIIMPRWTAPQRHTLVVVVCVCHISLAGQTFPSLTVLESATEGMGRKRINHKDKTMEARPTTMTFLISVKYLHLSRLWGDNI